MPPRKISKRVASDRGKDVEPQVDDGTSKHTYRYKGDNQNYLINYDYGYDLGMAWPNNSPGLYLDSTNNALKFILSTHPMNKSDQSMITSHDKNDDANMVTHSSRDLAMNSDGVDADDVQIKEEIDISNVPLDKWVCLVLRVKNKGVDVYVNGVITNRHYP